MTETEAAIVFVACLVVVVATAVFALLRSDV